MSVGLGDIPANLDPGLRDLLERVVESIGKLDGSIGDGTQRALTAGEVVGGITTGGGALPGGGGGGSSEPDLTPPPTPTGLSVAAGVTRVMVEVDQGFYSQGHGHDRTVIYGATWTSGPLPVFADAVALGDFPGTVGQFPSEPATTWRVWVTWRSADGVEGPPAGGTNGVEATTGQINNQQIGNAVIDDAKVANLSAAKLTAGTGVIGGPLYSSNFVGGVSGWTLHPNGYAEFSNVVIRNAVYAGTIYANAGTIGGVTIGMADMRTTNYVPATSGWRLNADGSAEFAAVSIYGQLQSGQIGNNQVTTDKLPTAAVTTPKIADQAVTYSPWYFSDSTWTLDTALHFVGDGVVDYDTPMSVSLTAVGAPIRLDAPFEFDSVALAGSDALVYQFVLKQNTTVIDAGPLYGVGASRRREDFMPRVDTPSAGATTYKVCIRVYVSFIDGSGSRWRFKLYRRALIALETKK